jgi:hypothetical protein
LALSISEPMMEHNSRPAQTHPRKKRKRTDLHRCRPLRPIEKREKKQIEEWVLLRPRPGSLLLKFTTCTGNWPPHLRGTTSSSDEPKKTGWRTRCWLQRNCGIRISHALKTN